MQLRFTPPAKGFHSSRVQVFVDEQRVAYADIPLCGWGVLPYLAFSDPAVRLPVVPVGTPASAVVFVRAIGYGSPPRLRAVLPTLTSAAPLALEFPDGDVASSEALPVVVSLRASAPVSFDAPISFYDPLGSRLVALFGLLLTPRFTIKVCATADHSLLTLYPHIARNRSAYYVAADGVLSPGATVFPHALFVTCVPAFIIVALTLFVDDYCVRVTSQLARWLSLCGLPSPQPISIPASFTIDAGDASLPCTV